jgi:uncharacterized protein
MQPRPEGLPKKHPMPILNHILLYPIKSLDGAAVTQAEILPGGALAGDREFAMVDQAGRWVNGKRTARIHGLRAQFDLTARQVIMASSEEPEATFHLDADRTALEQWLSDYFTFPITLQQNLITGFPDDLESPGPTLISTSTLATVAAWFPGLDVAEARWRFRTNLEFGDVPPFWEDRLYTATGAPVTFTIGAVEVQGINPCQRCPVPTRHPLTGVALPQFQKIFGQQRQAKLPDWAAANRFNHFYRLAVNTRIAAAEAGKVLRVGDELSGVTG